MTNIFDLFNEDEQSKINEFINECYLKHIEIQKREIKNPDPFVLEMWEDGFPYTGAIGGEIVYQFITTSLGMIKKVIYSPLPNTELDLTDYNNW